MTIEIYLRVLIHMKIDDVSIISEIEKSISANHSENIFVRFILY